MRLPNHPHVPYLVILFIVSSTLDVGYCAIAGLLAGLAAERVSGGGGVDIDVVRLGALVGMVKSIAASFSVVLCRASGSNVAAAVIYLASCFVIPFISAVAAAQQASPRGKQVSVVMWNSRLGHSQYLYSPLVPVPNGITTAALAAAVPLLFSNTLNPPTGT